MTKIMLVDDSPIILSVINNIIKQEVILATEVLMYSDSAKAKKHFKSVAPDVVITDIDMPIVDGFELIEYIKSIRTTPILAISASSFEDERTDALLYCAEKLGADYSLCKQDIPDKLSSVLSEIMVAHCLP